MSKTKGRLTLPSQANFLKETKELIERWGADAIRDSDGTKLDEATKQLDAKIYTTYFVARNHNEFAEKHMEECQQIYVMSKFHLATSNELEIPFMDGYFTDKFNQITFMMKNYIGKSSTVQRGKWLVLKIGY